uniref:Large tegument protein n=1 Tax=Elephant endotheliotropic herpesvirus 1A TaxID=759753 RepID=A0A8B6NPV6_ELHV1|nr:large tegument protein [Elephant endotheliotropic herpesvirus 1A]QOE74703.1 large tegument protein [Elephant endotheliotropic herpesvirus 1A]QOE74823.1 large tegument protein [Elephant endotheliotropic herpesvirus 1A]
MIILITGTRNQSHGEYGQRRGSQCMCNCFVFLHACFLKQPEFLTGAHIDDILLHGTILDNQAPAPARPTAYRLPSDIPTNIITVFGETMHKLGTPYGGLAESVDMDGHYYLGLFDFLYKMKQKRRGTTQLTLAFITINCTTRGLCVKDDLMYLFDPHETPYSENASILVTEDVNEIFRVLYRERLYFDAGEVFFIQNVQNLTDVEVAMIFSHIPDTSIEIPRPVVVRPVPQRPSDPQSGIGGVPQGSLTAVTNNLQQSLSHSLSGPFSTVSSSGSSNGSMTGAMAPGPLSANVPSENISLVADPHAPSIGVSTLDLLRSEGERGTCPVRVSGLSLRSPSALCHPHPGCQLSRQGQQSSPNVQQPSSHHTTSQPHSLQSSLQSLQDAPSSLHSEGGDLLSWETQGSNGFVGSLDYSNMFGDSLNPETAVVHDDVLATLLPSLTRLEELRVNMSSFLPPPEVHMVISSEQSSSCELSLFTFRLHHLFCQVIDVGVNNGTGLRSDIESILRHLQATFEEIQLPDLARLMELCIHTKLNARQLYRKIIDTRSTELTRPYMYVIKSKLNAVFQRHRFDTALAIRWVEQYYRNLLQPACQAPPPPSSDNLIAFVRQDFQAFSATCQELFDRQLGHANQHEVAFNHLKRQVTDYNNARAAVEASNTISNLNLHLQQNATEFIHHFYDDTVTATVEEFADVLANARSNIVAGRMPTQNLNRLLQKVINIMGLINDIKQISPNKRSDYKQRLNDVKHGISFLLGKEHDSSRIHESLRNLKRSYENTQTTVSVRDSRRDVCQLQTPDMTVARSGRTPQPPSTALLPRRRGDMEPMVQETSNYYVDLYDIEDMDGEDMDYTVTDQERNELRVLVSNMTLDNLGNCGFLTSPQFVAMLESPDFAQMFHVKILSLIDNILTRMASMTRVREIIFAQIRNVIAAVINNPVKERFLSIILFLESISLHIPVQRFTDLKKVLWKTKRYHTTWGFLKTRQSGMSLSEALNDLDDEFAQRGKEESWVRRAKNYTITSEQEAMQFLFNAPSDELRREFEPQILLKLRIFNENEAKARDHQVTKDRKKLSERRVQIEQNILTGIDNGLYTSSVGSQQLLELRGIYASEPEIQLYTDFNNKLSDLMNSRKPQIENILRQAILDNLNNVFTPPRYLNQLRELIAGLNDVKTNGLLTAGNEQLLADLAFDVKFLEDLVKDWTGSEPVFLGSRYREDYREARRLHGLVSGLVGPTDTIRAMEQRLNDYLGREEPIDSNHFILNPKDMPILSQQDTMIMEDLYEPFRQFVEDKQARKQAELRDTIALSNFNMKSKIDTHNILITQTRRSLPYIIKRHYLKISNLKRFDIEKFCQNPVDFIYNTILPSMATTPYVETGMILQWVSELRGLMSRFLTSDENAMMDIVKEWIDREIVEADEKAELEASLAITLDPERYETILSELDKNRVRGGERTYRKYEMDLAELKRDREVFDRSISLDMRLERLMRDIRENRFGLNCTVMLNEVQKLEDDSRDVAQQSYKVRLERLKAYVKGMLDLQRKIVAKQPSIIDINSFVIPTFNPDDMEINDTLSRLFRRMAFRQSEIWYLVENAFGEREYVNRDFCSSQHKICYRNCALKYYDLYQEGIDQDEETEPLISRNYLAHEVALQLANTVYTYWANVVQFPLSRYIQRPLLRRHAHVASLYSIKLCVYALDFYYAHMSQGHFPLETRVRGTYVKINQKAFMSIMMAFYPNVMLGIISLPLDVGVNSMIQKFSIDNFYLRCNVTSMPPPRELFTNNIVSYCIHENQWEPLSPADIFWNDPFFQELGGNVSKLTLYVLGVLALPTEYLNHLWNQFKHPDLPDITVFEYVKIIFKGIFNKNLESPCQPPADPAVLAKLGTILESVKISRNVEVEDVVKHFQQKLDLFDCVVGSLLLNVPIVIAQRVCRVHEQTVLVVNIGSLTHGDQDYLNVIGSRNLDFSELTNKTWSAGNMIEQSWFEAQTVKIREFMTKPRSQNPLLILVDDTKTVFNAYLPRSDRRAQQQNKLFICDHMYQDQMHSGNSTGVVDFAFCPTDVNFLSDPYDLTSPNAAVEGYGAHIPDAVVAREGTDTSRQHDLYDPSGMDTAQDASSRGLDAKKRASQYINDYVIREHAASGRRTRRIMSSSGGGGGPGGGGGGSHQPVQSSSLTLPVTVRPGTSGPSSLGNVVGLNSNAVSGPRESSAANIQRQLNRASCALQRLQQDVTFFKDRMLEMLHKTRNVYQ